MGRKIRTTLSTLERNLQPSWPDKQRIRQKDEAEKKKQAFYYNRRHGARPLPPLQPGGNVLTKLDHQKSWTAPAVVTTVSVTPRSYIIQTQQGQHSGATGATSRRCLLHSHLEAKHLSYLFARTSIKSRGTPV